MRFAAIPSMVPILDYGRQQEEYSQLDARGIHCIIKKKERIEATQVGTDSNP